MSRLTCTISWEAALRDLMIRMYTVPSCLQAVLELWLPWSQLGVGAKDYGSWVPVTAKYFAAAAP